MTKIAQGSMPIGSQGSALSGIPANAKECSKSVSQRDFDPTPDRLLELRGSGGA